MKKLFFLVASLFIFWSSCKKNKTPTNPIDQLPPETQTGANTFGCLVNGEVFKPGGASLTGGSLQCNYQFVSNGYYFVLIGRNKTGGNYLTSIGLYTDSLKIQENSKLSLRLRANGNPSGDYFKSLNAYQYELYNTKSSYTGELFIKKLDSINQIASGTFWFDAVNSSGQVVQVREGRFDMKYVR